MNNIREEITRPRKVALYKSINSEFYTVDEVRFITYDKHYCALPNGQTRESAMTGFVRVSEPVNVTFQPLDDDSIVQKAVESLDEAEREAIRELNAKIAAIRAQKAQLLALTHDVQS